MLSWEFPPMVIGGLGRHVDELSRCLPNFGVESHVLTPRVNGCLDNECHAGTHIYRIGTPMPNKDFRPWIFGFNSELIKKAVHLYHFLDGFDLVHAHDWLVGYAGRSISRVLNIPLVTTIHATESGRNRGLHTPIQQEIHDIESNLIRESDHILCCSNFMCNEIISLFDVDSKQVTVIPNGVNLNPYADGRGNEEQDLSQYGIEPDDQVIFHIGRLVPEKGVEVLIGAFARVADERPRAKLIIGGRGSQTGQLKAMAADLGLTDRIVFTGYIPDEIRDMIYCRADVAVFPSIYEPFGIVVLEAMASGVPVVVSDAGGLSEIVSHGETGLKVARGNEQDLARAMLLITSDFQKANRMRLKAVQMIKEQYNWNRIADMTSQVYFRVSGRAKKDGVLK